MEGKTRRRKLCPLSITRNNGLRMQLNINIGHRLENCQNILLTTKYHHRGHFIGGEAKQTRVETIAKLTRPLPRSGEK